MKLWKLSITTYKGTCLGAVHYYATLWVNGKDYKVEYLLTQEDMARFGDVNGDWHRLSDGCTQFWTEEEAEKAALVVWEALKGSDDLLVRGKNHVHTPSEALCGDPALVKLANEIHQEYKNMVDLHPDASYANVREWCSRWDSEILARFDRERDNDTWTEYCTVRKVGENYEFVESWS